MLTIITPAANKRLASAADLVALVPGMTTQQAEKLLDQSGAMIEAECRRVLVSEMVKETLRDVCASMIMLERWPVASITSVVVDGVTLAGTDHEVDGSRLFRLSGDARIAWVGAKIEITYVGGYSIIPADLARASLDLAVNLNASQGRDTSVRSINIPDVEQVSYRDDGNGGGLISGSISAVIDAYRDYRL